MAEKNNKREIVSFNDLSVDFNFDDVALEKLESQAGTSGCSADDGCVRLS